MQKQTSKQSNMWLCFRFVHFVTSSKMEAHYLYAALVALLTVAVVCGKPEPHPGMSTLMIL